MKFPYLYIKSHSEYGVKYCGSVDVKQRYIFTYLLTG